MKIFTATFGTETNTFSPLPTGLDSFDALFHVPGSVIALQPVDQASGTNRAVKEAAQRGEIEAAFGMTAFAQPGGTTTREAFEKLRDELLGDLRAALPVAGVALHLHGAMVADGYDDCEGDVLSHVRDIVGHEVPVGVLLDPHCHLSDAMVANTNSIVCYKEYPHTDVDDRAREVVSLVFRQARGEIAPCMSLFDCRMISMFHTTAEPMKSFVAGMHDIERNDPLILSVSTVHGFPWGDVPAMGTKVLVVADGDQRRAVQLARELGEELRELRNAAHQHMRSIEEVIAELRDDPPTPIVIADVSDNPGGGAPSDSTRLLRALLNAGYQDLAAAFIWDPGAVEIAARAGAGARLALRIGGKTSALCGDPLDLDVVVKAVVRNATEDFAGVTWQAGTLVWVQAGSVDLILISNRIQAFTPKAFEQAGLSLAKKAIVVVKSSQHFHAAFAPTARTIIYCDPPGVMSLDLAALPYEKIERPKWPFDEDAFV